MNSFGEFLKQKRQEKKLTQKELAKLLFISESAVSKWEKDIAHPDITLLPKLAQILNVTEHELITASIDKQTREEKSQARKWRAPSILWNLFFYISYGIAIITCFICNLAINKTLSWFWIVVSALLLAFTFTNLPKLIKKHKLLLIPLSMYLALCLLLGVCCIYTKGNWFFIATISVLLGLTTIFTPIYISQYTKFKKIKKFNDFISIGIIFILLNILLLIIEQYTISNELTSQHWYFKIALPITISVYLILSLFLCVRFLKTNKLLKTSIILFIISLLYILLPFIKVNHPAVQEEIQDINIFKANLSIWKLEQTLDNNIHLIIFLTTTTLAFVFLTFGLILYIKKRKIKK